MSLQLLKRLPALVLLAGGIVLLQSHAMDYWSRYDSATGWLWSLVIEGAAIWLWAARSGLKNTIAVFATTLALAAPLYQLAAPVLESQRAGEQSVSTLPSRIANRQAEIQQLETDLATYNENSKHRGGWLEIIATTKADLKTARNNLNELQAEQTPSDWQAWMQIGTQGMALIIIQCLVVLTTRTVFAPLAASSVGGNSFPKQQRGTQTAAPAAEVSKGTGRAHADQPQLTLVKRLAARTGLIPAAS